MGYAPQPYPQPYPPPYAPQPQPYPPQPQPLQIQSSSSQSKSKSSFFYYLTYIISYIIPIIIIVIALKLRNLKQEFQATEEIKNTMNTLNNADFNSLSVSDQNLRKMLNDIDRFIQIASIMCFIQFSSILLSYFIKIIPLILLSLLVVIGSMVLFFSYAGIVSIDRNKSMTTSPQGILYYYSVTLSLGIICTITYGVTIFNLIANVFFGAKSFTMPHRTAQQTRALLAGKRH